jgi:hypothetical protein
MMSTWGPLLSAVVKKRLAVLVAIVAGHMAGEDGAGFERLAVDRLD